MDAGKIVLALQSSRQSDTQIIRQATDYLKSCASDPKFCLTLLEIVANDAVPESDRLAASIQFQRYVEKQWVYEEGAPGLISSGDRDLIKRHLLTQLLKAPRLVKMQLSQALVKIAASDFPEKWETLMPEMIEKLHTDVATNVAVWDCLNSMFMRYRSVVIDGGAESKALNAEMLYVLKLLQEKLLQQFHQALQSIEKCKQDKAALALVMEEIHLIIQIVHSLNFPDINAYVEDHMKDWFLPLKTLLSFQTTLLDPKDEDKPGILDSVQEKICGVIDLFASNYEEQFHEFVPEFVTTVWQLLVSRSSAGRYDELLATAMKFLTSLCRKETYKQLFQDPSALKQICENVIIPQLMLRDSDEELFSQNGQQYVLRDMEGSDVDTRRRTASDFIRGLCVHYENEVSALLKGHVEVLLKEFAANPKNYKAKDAAMFIVLALTVKGQTRQQGATTLNAHIDIMGFFQSQVIPELQSANVNETPVIKADCLKFIAVFRRQLPKDSYLLLFGLVAKFLQADEYVVHTYAAHALERLFSVKEDNGAFRVDEQMLLPVLEPILSGLFSVLETKDESDENEYVARAIMRVSVMAKSSSVKFAEFLLGKVTFLLQKVSRNPKNPQFNHYLFEIVACLISNICPVSSQYVGAFEAKLVPLFLEMLKSPTCEEFQPYIFQILALILEFTSTADGRQVSANFTQMYPALLSPTLWENLGNAPALVRLLNAFVAKAPKTVEAMIEALLGVYQKLNALQRTDAFGHSLLSCVYASLPMNMYGKFLKDIFALQFRRLKAIKDTAASDTALMYPLSLIPAWSVFAVVNGPQALIEGMNLVQPGMFTMVLEKVILPDCLRLQTMSHRRACALLLAGLVTSDLLLQPDKLHLWAKTLEVCLKVLDLREKAIVTEIAAEAVREDFLEASKDAFQTSYVRLVCAGLKGTDRDPLVGANFKDPKETLITGLVALSQRHPGKLTSLIVNGNNNNGCDQKAKELLQEYLTDLKVALQ